MRAFLDRFVGNLSPSALMISTSFWSWMDLVPFSPLLFASAGVQAGPLPLALSLFVGVLVLAGLAASRHAREGILSPRLFFLASLLCGAFGTLVLFSGALWDRAPLVWLGAILSGLFQGAGIALVGCIAVCQGKTNALIHLAACLPFNIVFVLLGMFLQPMAAVVLCCLLPLLSALSYKVYLERGNNARQIRVVCEDVGSRRGQQCGTSPVRQAVGLIVLLLLITFAFGLVNSQVQFAQQTTASDAIASYSSLFIRAGIAAWVLYSYIFRARQPFELLVSAVAVMALGLFALCFASGSSSPLFAGGYILLYTGYALFDLLIWAILVIVHRMSGTRWTLQKYVYAAYALDQLGNFLGTACGAVMPAGLNISPLLGCLGAALIVCAFAVLNLRAGFLRDLHVAVVDKDELAEGNDDDARSRERNETHSGETSAFAAVSPDEARVISQDVRLLAARYFLTEREEEVLDLLVAGRSVPYISEKLMVSTNTVKTHVRHIYAKLDVHNRQELLDVFDHSDSAC